MLYFVAALCGMVMGALCVFFLLESRRRQLSEARRKLEHEAQHLTEKARGVDDLGTRNKLEQEKLKSEKARLERATASLAARVKLEQENLSAERQSFEALPVSYRELQEENHLLKRDLQNLEVGLRKLQLDRDIDREKHDEIDRRCAEVGTRHLKDTVKWIESGLTANNFASSKQRLLETIGRCRSIGLGVSVDQEREFVADLQSEYERLVRAAFEREEQARIRAQIREEQARQREIDRELARLERERTAIQAALDRALADAKNQHSAEIEQLKARLAEAEENSRRAVAQAELTKAGYVYVVSNVGSFGQGVFKIGMTRRLEPVDRIRELGDASVPFPFDIHMMISCDDAPALENAIHRALRKNHINKVNPRKEFFRSDIQTIYHIVADQHGKVEYVADAEALEYRQSLDISSEDQEFIDSTFERVYRDRVDED